MVTRRILYGLFGAVLSAATVSASPAQEILRAAGVKGGLVVHVGCGDGALTMALRAGDG